ncbi:MAG: type II toxin-antitoxin system HicA family toxin [Dehalococcoidia bacterium]|nr:type II toxin-antitoxin system HicA family toxin [Dehalococcoidia bacterium]MDZ4277558.1 type II toxin-antitoxin system HicA family toxin [Dehalococcoidia bacterium]
MPRLPRATAPDVIRALERAGFARVRARGSHWVFRHTESRRRVVVPYHQSRIMPPGTLANVLREAGLTADDLERLLKG